MAAAAAQDSQALVLPASSPHTAIEMAGLPARSAPPAAPATTPPSDQAEEGSLAMAATATADEGEENRRKAEIWYYINIGTATILLGFFLLLGCFSYNGAGRENVALLISTWFLLAFCNMVSGVRLVLLGVNMLGLRARADGQYIAVQRLTVSCVVLSVLTVFSLVALFRSRLYEYIGLAVVTAVLLLAAGMYWWFLWRRSGGSDEARDEELQTTSKIITSCVTTSAFAGLLAVLFQGPEFFGAAADAIDGAPYVAIFFMCATGLLGLFVMTVLNLVPGITNQAIRRANALLLLSLACAALAAAFVVLKYCVFVTFTPWVITVTGIFLWHRAPGDQRVNLQERRKTIEEHASKVMSTGFGLIMTLLGATSDAKDSSQLAVVGRDMSMVVLTSAFVSSLGIMVLAVGPRSVRALMDPAATVLTWTSMALLVVPAAVYWAEVRRIM